MNVADAPVRKFRSQLTVVHQREIARAFTVDKLLHQDAGASPAHLQIEGLKFFSVLGVAWTSGDLHGAIGLGLDRTARLQDGGKSHRCTGLRACSALQTIVVFGTAIPRDAANRTVSKRLWSGAPGRRERVPVSPESRPAVGIATESPPLQGSGLGYD